MVKPAPAGSLPRVAFVVDDDRRVRTLLAKVLANTGFFPEEFSRVTDVEIALTRVKPEIILLDLSLGGSDAVEMMKSLRAAHFTGRIMLMSGHGAGTLAEVQAIGERHGLTMLPFLTKPFEFADLKRRLTMLGESVPDAVAAADLRSGLENSWLQLWYQPKIDLNSMLICGAEALIRLRHPVRGIVQPADFLPRPGDELYKPLTDFVVRRALADWSLFAENRMTKRIAINVPASVLQRSDFVDHLRQHLPTHPKFPGLIVEITEDEAISDLDLARETAVRLKLYNVHMSIDDFGSGYASLDRLSEIPFAEIKLDRSFVQGCATSDRKRVMCKAVVQLAQKFNVMSVAEGVETQDDLDVIRDMGYQVAQGYLFAKPMVRDDFVKLVLSHTRS